MDYFNKLNTVLLGPAGNAPPSAVDTIHKITDRLTQSTLLSDRRAAVLSLKGLTRDWKAEVGEHSLQALLVVLQTDAKEDSDIGKAVLETIGLLCECPEPDDTGNLPPVKGKGKVPKDDLGLKHTDIVLATPEPTHTLLYLFTQTSFYIRFTSVQLLSTLLHNRPQKVQHHFLSDPGGPSSILAILTETREIIRNEALLLTQSLIASNVDIQKSLAFEGVLEALLGVVSQEGGVEGGIVVQDCLTIVDGLLRFNASNQSYFRELSLPSLLPGLLLFPSPPPAPDQPTPQEFSLQFWDAQKLINATILVEIIGLLSHSKGANQKSLEQSGTSRCLIEIALSSNAPPSLKTEALKAISPLANLNQPLTPYIPVPDTNGEEWDRLPEESALSSLIGVALDGEFGGVIGAAIPGVVQTPEKEGLELRAAAASLFESYVAANVDLRLWIISGMIIPAGSPAPEEESSPSLRILRSLAETPPSPLTPPAALKTLFANLLFASIIRGSAKCKAAAEAIIPSHLLFPTPPGEAKTDDDDDDPPQSLLAHLMGNVALALRARAQARDQGAKGEVVEWDRVVVGNLIVLSLWCWGSPSSVKEVLDEGGALGVLVEPITQTSDVDVLVQGLSAFLLGICYEFDRDPGEITRSTLYTLVDTRIGADTFISRINRVREDARFKAVAFDSMVVSLDSDGYEVPKGEDAGVPPKVWLDWPFIEFWKSNYYTIQKSIATDPNEVVSSGDVSAETEAMIASLKDIIRGQAEEMEVLQGKVAQLSREAVLARENQVQHIPPPPPVPFAAPKTDPAKEAQIVSLSEQVKTLEGELEAERVKRKEVEKEQEDLLVLLDELSTKRTNDKLRMREKGMEVSEGEDEDDSDEAGEDEDDDA